MREKPPDRDHGPYFVTEMWERIRGIAGLSVSSVGLLYLSISIATRIFAYHIALKKVIYHTIHIMHWCLILLISASTLLKDPQTFQQVSDASRNFEIYFSQKTKLFFSILQSLDCISSVRVFKIESWNDLRRQVNDLNNTLWIRQNGRLRGNQSWLLVIARS